MEDEMGGTEGKTHGRSGKCKLKERVNLEDLGVDETIVSI
jgi:hypothetical protein